MNLPELDQFLRYVILISSISALIVWGMWIYYNKKRWKYAITPIFFLLHYLIFFILGYFNLIEREFYIIWRDLIFIHAISILISSGLVMIRFSNSEAK